MRFHLLFLLGLLGAVAAHAQAPPLDHVYMKNIRTVKFNQSGNYLSYPIITLNGGDRVDLQFDDLDADTKDYYYDLQLCNADWTPADINRFDYLRGFSESRITDYQFSSMALQKYTHYKLTLPNQDCNPLRSGNYLLKVFLNSDTSQLVLTRRLLIQEPLVSVEGNIRQPINPKLFYTSQKVNFSLNTKGLNINNPYDQLKVYVLQNFRWDNCISGLQPMFLKGDVIEYNTENDCIFPGGKEWRWQDLRNFHLRTAPGKNQPDTSSFTTGNNIRITPEYNRAGQQYEYYKDVNGMFLPAMLDNYDVSVEGDYARVTFTFPTQQPFAGYNLYLFGEMTGYELNNDNRLIYNGQKGAYECTLYLKQGVYSYLYGVVDMQDPQHKLNTELTEGNSWEAENDYTILVYYRALGARSDQLVNATTWNSLKNR